MSENPRALEQGLGLPIQVSNHFCQQPTFSESSRRSIVQLQNSLMNLFDFDAGIHAALCVIAAQLNVEFECTGSLWHVQAGKRLRRSDYTDVELRSVMATLLG